MSNLKTSLAKLLPASKTVDSIVSNLSDLVTQLDAVQAKHEAEVDAQDRAIAAAEAAKATAKAELARAAVVSQNIRTLLGKA